MFPTHISCDGFLTFMKSSLIKFTPSLNIYIYCSAEVEREGECSNGSDASQWGESLPERADVQLKGRGEGGKEASSKRIRKILSDSTFASCWELSNLHKLWTGQLTQLFSTQESISQLLVAFATSSCTCYHWQPSSPQNKSEWVSEWVSDKHNQWSDSGLITTSLSFAELWGF